MKRRLLGLIVLQMLLGGSVTAWADIVGFDNGAGFTTSSNGTGDPTISNGVLTLTDSGFHEARAAFYNTTQSITSFTAQFTYQATSGGGIGLADGVAFVLQNDPRGAGALGVDGTGLGYGGISPSAAVEFNLFTLYGIGTALGTNGLTGTYIPTTPVDITSGDQIQVTLEYSGTTGKETLLDLSNNNTFSTSDTINLASVLGANTAYVGFTGATGDGTSTQKISNFSFINTQAVPAPPSLVIAGTSALVGLLSFLRRSGPDRPGGGLDAR